MANQQVTKVIDSVGQELFTETVTIGVSVAPSKTFAKHPLEDSRVVTDDQYDNPTSLTLRVILKSDSYQDEYKRIKASYEAVSPLTIQTRVDVYQNMYIESLPHEESPDMYSTISMSIELTEQLITKSQTNKIQASNAASPADASAVNSGSKSTQQDSDGSIAAGLFDRAFN